MVARHVAVADPDAARSPDDRTTRGYIVGFHEVGNEAEQIEQAFTTVVPT